MAVILFSCDEDYENFESKAFLNQESKTTSFLIQPDNAGYTASLNVSVARPAAENLEFTFQADPSLLPVYNNLFPDKAEILPAGHYNLPDNKAIITKESVRSTEVSIHFTDINKLDRNKVYVLPVTVANNGKIDMLESGRTHYYIFKGGALINWAADIEKNNIPVQWKDNSQVSDMKEVTIEGLLYLRQIEREGSDSQIMTFFGVENKFLIRLGDTFQAGEIMVVKGSSGKYPDNANDRTKAPVGRWFHLAVTHDASNTLKIYIDGKLMSTTKAASGTINLASSCYIGKSFNDNRWWPGMICETRVWNVARTQEQIASSIYGVSPDSEGLIAYWKFNEGNGNTITDQTGNNGAITANSALKWTSVSLPE